MATQQQIDFLNSLRPEERQTLVGAISKKRESFIESSTQEDILNSEFNPETKKKLILDKRAFKIKSTVGETVTDIGNISEALQREEAVFASPLLNFVQSSSKVFGREKKKENVLEGMKSGLAGESFSSRRTGGQAEFGDAYEDLLLRSGVPISIARPAANIGGLATAELLPSSIATGMVGGAIARKFGQKAATTASKVLSKHVKKRTQFPFANMFRNKFRNAAESASTQEGVIAEILETGSNIDSDMILYAFRHPEALTEELARDEILTDIIDGVQSKVRSKKLSTPDLFNPTSSTPIKIADNITSNFDSQIKNIGKEVGDVKKEFIKRLGSEDFLSADELELQIVNILKEGDFLDDAGKIRDFRKNDQTRFLNSILNSVRGVVDEPGKVSRLVDEFGKPIILKEPSQRALTLQETFDLINKISDEAYNNATVIDGIRKPLPDVDAIARELRGRVNGLIRGSAEDLEFPELAETFDKFSKLANVRQNMPSNIRKDVSLAKFIRNMGKKNPEDLVDFNELVKSTGSADLIFNQISKFQQNQAIQLTEQFPWLKSDSPIVIEKGLRSILDKPLNKVSAEESRLIQQLEGMLDDNFLELVVNHKVAREFAGKSNVFRVQAAGGLFNKAMLPITGGIAGGIPGMIGGLAAADPRIQRALITNKGKIANFLKGIGKTVNTAASAGAKGTKIAVRRKLQEEKR